MFEELVNARSETLNDFKEVERVFLIYADPTLSFELERKTNISTTTLGVLINVRATHDAANPAQRRQWLLNCKRLMIAWWLCGPAA